MKITLELFLLIGAVLFCLGLYIIITKKNVIMVLMGIELILNASNVNLLAFSKFDPFRIQGQMFSIFIIVIAAAEAAVALAIVLRVYELYKTVDLDKINQLKD